MTDEITRMRPPIASIYNRQIAKCLSDISEVYELPVVVQNRIKKAIEYTCKDVDRLNRKERENPNGQDDNRFNR
jgi:hypothetical protein